MNRIYDVYRRQTTRLQKWEYSWCGYYFVTIEIKYGDHFFGEIENGIMFLNEVGEIAKEEWLKTPMIRLDMNIELDGFVVMPNHIHAIIHIGKNQYNCIDAMHRVDTNEAFKQKVGVKESHHKFGSQSKKIVINYERI
jgi:REP element-mobilizing transposase RayT